ncbi:MAG: hypothetical protein HFP77_02735 [Methylococcales symbiont of Iophon sp. n. MRB-2018]|nr:MAG: hypothetical protein HFP77_02735 [Methylococcales symbiont of Iophon sp. n. MRB-2018]KAF3980410.1 MAG: hypothetical protein HFP76_02320 [Methylococcales symbiont of Iophon sp. n. MRB-2018]
MKCSFTLFVLMTTVFMMSCTSGSKINGRSVKTANRSASMIKDRLPTEQRIEFEVSYWTVRDVVRNNKEFLDLVDGKTALEMVVLGKENFKKRKKSGFKGYEKYTNWEQMITKFTQERISQGKRSKKQVNRDRDNNVLYNL